MPHALAPGRELRALRRLQREQESKSPFVFVSERGTPFSNRGFQAMVERVARAAGFDMKIHPHMTSYSPITAFPISSSRSAQRRDAGVSRSCSTATVEPPKTIR
jgi:site-specific recombinase XerC